MTGRSERKGHDACFPHRSERRHRPPATAIALTLAGRVEFAVFATTYFLTEIPLMLCAIVVSRPTRERKEYGFPRSDPFTQLTG